MESWGDLIDEKDSEYFVGREQELNIFSREITPPQPRFLLFYITGQGGVGKTTLLHRYRTMAQAAGFLLADADQLQRTVPAMLGRFAHQLAEQQLPLKRFDERYKIYRQKTDEIANDPQAPHGLAATLGKTMIRATYIVGDMVPGLRQGLDFIPREPLEAQASEWVDYLARKFTNKEDLALMRDPIPILTSLFFEDLNEIARKHPILLCIDNFEATRQELQDWLLHLREYRPSLNIRIILAGRNPTGAMWDPLRKVTMVIYLDVFTQKEAEAFLDTYRITDMQHRQEIIKYSGRLPVLMSWLAASDTLQANVALPTQDIVERFLRWISEGSFRYVAEIAAFPRIFNVDMLTYVLKEQGAPIDAQTAFAWLQTMPFVQQLTEGWCYHDVVRRMMLRHQSLKSPQSYQNTHRLLADFYEKQCQILSMATKQTWTNTHWRKHMLSFLYHLLLADPHRYWAEVIDQIIIATHRYSSFAFEILEVLDDANIHDTLDQDQENLIKALRQQLPSITKGDFQDGFALFEQLCHIPDLSPEAKGYTYAFRGEYYRQCEQWEKALSDFGEALQYVVDDIWIMSHRSDVYRMTKRYEEALADLNHVLTIDHTSSWAFSIRAQVYRQMGRLTEALLDLNRAIELDEKDNWSIACRGQLYQQMGNYTEALADLNYVIAIDQNDAWSITQRGRTHFGLGNYEEAISDFDRVSKLGKPSREIFTLRGTAYWELERYKEALADFDCAISMSDKDAWVFATRGSAYWKMGYYVKALSDYDRAIDLQPQKDWYWYLRASTRWLISDTAAFQKDLATAIEIAQRNLQDDPSNMQTSFNLALYLLTNNMIEEAQQKYEALIFTCTSVKILKDILFDIKFFLTNYDSFNEIAQYICARVHDRIAILEHES